jgi:hypothetical protein
MRVVEEGDREKIRAGHGAEPGQLLGVPEHATASARTRPRWACAHGLAWTSGRRTADRGSGHHAGTGQGGRSPASSARSCRSRPRPHPVLHPFALRRVRAQARLPQGTSTSTCTCPRAPRQGTVLGWHHPGHDHRLGPSEHPVRNDWPMTRDHLRGRFLPIGGMREKNSGRPRGLFVHGDHPGENEKDLKEVPQHSPGLEIVKARTWIRSWEGPALRGFSGHLLRRGTEVPPLASGWSRKNTSAPRTTKRIVSMKDKPGRQRPSGGLFVTVGGEGAATCPACR